MKLSELQQSFASDTVLLFQYILEQGYTFTYGEAMRSAEQAELYAKEGKGILDSQHCKKLAVDLQLFANGVFLQDKKDYQLLGEYWESLNPDNRWGGKFPRCDFVHYEMRD